MGILLVITDIIIRIKSYLGSSADNTVNTVWLKNHNTTITSQMNIKFLSSVTLSFGEEYLGLSHKEVVTPSLYSSFAMELFLASVYTETIMTIGKCSRNSFLWYIQIQVRNFNKGISDVVVSTRLILTTP